MLVCPLCRIALGAHDANCPRDGHLGQAASWNLVPAALEKRFTLIAPFAHGLTGSTYVADEPETGRRGLLKVMAPAPAHQAAERQRTRRELLKQATMSAAHLALPYATGETEGVLWLFRESIEGTALSALLSSDGPLPQHDALLIAAQLATALDDLHRAGLLHRDVKPGHIIIGREANGAPRAHLIDAGVCRPLEGASSTTVFGTPGYVAPEQLVGKLVSFRSDLYALGCVIVEMLSGTPAFVREDVASTLLAQQSGDLPEYPAGQSPQLNALLSSLLAKDPQDRPFSAQKLRRALDPFLPNGATVNRHPNASLAKPPAGASRIPPPPSQPQPPRPATRTSMPPPPPGRKNPDATQALQIDQIMEMSPAAPKQPSVAPPPPTAKRSAESELARRKDSTEPVELDSVLEVSSPAPTKPQVEDKPKETRPSADHTQPIRLDQILAVADQRKKAMSVPPVLASESVAPAPAPEPAVAQSQPEAPPSIELEIPDETPDSPFRSHAESLAAQPGAPAAALPVASAQSDLSLATTLQIEDEHPDDAGTDNQVTVIAERPTADKRALQSTLVGMPHAQLPVPEAGTVARGSEAPPPQLAVDTPKQVEVRLGEDSAQLTLPRDPALAIAEAERMQAAAQQDASEDEIRLPVGSANSRKIGMALAAAAVLGLLGLGVSRLFGGEEEAVAKQDKPTVESAPTASAAPVVKDPTPSVQPLAQAPKAEPAPVVTSIPEPTVAPPAEAQKPAEEKVEAAPEEPKSKASDSSREERRERRAQKRESSSANKEELWAKARDEARGHYASKRYKQAAQAYEQAAKYNPSHAGTFAGLGSARMQSGDTRGAIQAYQRAVQLSPSTSGFHAALGRAYITAGDKNKARSAYKRALALDPKNEAAKTALATL